MRDDKTARNLELYRLRKKGVTFRALAEKYAISNARARDIVRNLERHEEWGGPLEPMKNRFTLREVAEFLGLSYARVRKFKDLKIERYGYGGHTWVRRSELKVFLLKRLKELREELARHRALLAKIPAAEPTAAGIRMQARYTNL